MMPAEAVPPCGACGARVWAPVYVGEVRDGVFGRECAGRVLQCQGCGVEYLAEPGPVGMTAYRDGSYRLAVGELPGAEAFFRAHDRDLQRIAPFLPFERLRGTRVADIGCAGGAVLDMVVGLAAETIAVEPADAYHASLRERGHEVYPDIETAVAHRRGTVDLAVCLSVIEHVEHPRSFLALVRELLAPGGTAILSTPNRGDLLMAIGCDAYRRFFYRVVHRYYFDAASLHALAEAAGFRGVTFRYHQRFDFGNFVGWLHHGRPTGSSIDSPLGTPFDAVWRHQLEISARADYLFAYCSD